MQRAHSLKSPLLRRRCRLRLASRSTDWEYEPLGLVLMPSGPEGRAVKDCECGRRTSGGDVRDNGGGRTILTVRATHRGMVRSCAGLNFAVHALEVQGLSKSSLVSKTTALFVFVC